MGVIGVILGLLAIVGGVVLTFMFGTAGAIAVGVLVLLAIVLGIAKRKKDGKGGIGAIVIAVLAALLTLAMTGFWSNTFSSLHDKAVQVKPEGLWAQATLNTNGGLYGIISQLPNDEASVNALMEEMNELNQLSEQ